MYGSFDLTDGYLLYINQARPHHVGHGPLPVPALPRGQDLRERRPSSLRSGGALLRRRWARCSYPLSTFTFLEGDLEHRRRNYFLDDSTAFNLRYNTDPARSHGESRRRPAGRVARQNGGTALPDGGSRCALGYNTLRYHYACLSAIDGTSLLLETVGGCSPSTARSTATCAWTPSATSPSAGSTHFILRGGVGTTFGGRFAQLLLPLQLRHPARRELRRRAVAAGPATTSTPRWSCSMPLNGIVRVAFLSTIMGVAGLDFGGVGDRRRDSGTGACSTAAVGVNVGLGPLLMRLHFAYPLDINAPAGRPTAGWVTKFSIGVAGLNGFFGDRARRSQHTARRASGGSHATHGALHGPRGRSGAGPRASSPRPLRATSWAATSAALARASGPPSCGIRSKSPRSALRANFSRSISRRVRTPRPRTSAASGPKPSRPCCNSSAAGHRAEHQPAAPERPRQQQPRQRRHPSSPPQRAVQVPLALELVAGSG